MSGLPGLAFAFLICALVMAAPVVMLKLKDKPFFRQHRP
jgi:hypothetical protein